MPTRIETAFIGYPFARMNHALDTYTSAQIDALIQATKDEAKYITVTLGETVAAWTVVCGDADGKVYAAGITEAGDRKIFGIAVAGGDLDDSVFIAREGTDVTNPAWNWSPGPVYCGEGGVLTQSLTGLVTAAPVAVAVAPTKLVVTLMRPLDME